MRERAVTIFTRDSLVGANWWDMGEWVVWRLRHGPMNARSAHPNADFISVRIIRESATRDGRHLAVLSRSQVERCLSRVGIEQRFEYSVARASAFDWAPILISHFRSR